MEFVTAKRDHLIDQLKDMISMLKECPKSMDFNVIIEYCGIDPRFKAVALRHAIKRAEKQPKIELKKEGNI